MTEPSTRTGASSYPCPCCGYLSYDEPPGSYQICDVCFWEDDIAQLRWPLMAGGPNGLCLVDGQPNFETLGAMARDFVDHVVTPGPTQQRDAGWRPIDLAIDNFEDVGVHEGEPSALTDLYWWRPTFWRQGLVGSRPRTGRWVSAGMVEPGMTLELTGDQVLWDYTTSPWRTLAAGAQLVVVAVDRIATSRPGHEPIELSLRAIDTGSRIVLEVEAPTTLRVIG